MADDDVAELQAKLEQAEREHLKFIEEHNFGAFETLRARAEAAESALAAAQGALREARDHAWKAGCRGYLGDDFFAKIDAALAEPRAAPPALPAELSGKGKQPALCGDWNPNKYEGVGPLRCGRLPGHKPPHTAFIPDFSYETRRTVNWGGPDEGAAKEQPEPGEAKKEEGT